MNIRDLTQDMINYASSVNDELEKLTEALCEIPAPSHHEEKRAEFCKKWFVDNGCNAFIDNALNVICSVGDDQNNDLVVFSAHTDTVFPELDPLPFSKDETKLYSPSAGDDTVCLAILMLCARYVVQSGKKTNCGILFVANSCEEGLGNLKGMRELMSCYGNRIKAHFSFDSKYTHIINRCVGSHRYKVTVQTEGGHSFSGFGKPNAIHIASQLINRLYDVQVPHIADSITTYNVGVIEGGTSVNTIAQACSFLYEYRSNDSHCLAHMKEEFERIVSVFSSTTNIKIELLGERPCMNGVDLTVLDAMSEACKAVQEKYSGVKCTLTAGSTDCNIPMSMGIPAIALGVFDGGGEHTYEEYVLRSSLPNGMKIAMEIICSYLEQ